MVSPHKQASQLTFIPCTSIKNVVLLAFPARFKPHAAAVHFDDVLDDIEAVAGRIGIDLLRVFAPAALGKDAPRVFFADAAVLDGAKLDFGTEFFVNENEVPTGVPLIH